MNRVLKTFAICTLMLAAATASAEKKSEKKAEKKTEKISEKKGAKKMTTVIIKTSMGNIEVELNEEKAPLSYKNFLKYVDKKHYDGTIFHRVIATFMIQGGGMDEKMVPRPTDPPIDIESKNGLKNDRGTIAMARTSDPKSATSQFFINVVNNDFLNYKDPSPQGVGYAVFGRVTSGLEVVDKIKATPVGSGDVPKTPVVIQSISRK